MNDYGYKYGYAPLAPWERELLYGKQKPTLNSVENEINTRIRSLEDELNETFRLIGQALIRGNDTAEWTEQAKVVEARIDELKNVLNMIGG